MPIIDGIVDRGASLLEAHNAPGLYQAHVVLGDRARTFMACLRPRPRDRIKLQGRDRRKGEARSRAQR